MNRQRAILNVFICFLSLLTTGVAAAQSTTETERGIPINDPLIISKCAGCHARDANGMMRRISYIRTTPEVWEQILKRMIRLNGLVTTPEESRQILRYLSSNNGLAPQEARPVFWEVEHRLFRTQEEEAGAVPAQLQLTCNQCHTIGRVLSQRRTAADYVKLANTHMALFPGAEPMVFRPQERYAHPEDIPVTTTQLNEYETALNYPPAPPKSDTGATRYPIDVALEYLAKNQPLITPEWVAWKDTIRAPKLAGTWLVSAYQPGKGKVYGETTIEATSTPDDFVTKTVLHYPDGQVLTRTGKGIVYSGYSWRGHATATASGANDAAFPADSREAMFLSADGNTFDGRWFWGGYQEFGLDVQLTRLQRNTVILGFDQFSVPSPSSSDLHIYGANLPAGLTPADFDLGKGVQVTKVVRSSPTEVLLQIAVAPGLPAAPHNVSVKGIIAPQTLTVYGKVDYIKVSPDASFARLGGTIAPKQYAIFQTLGFANGEDGKPGTADDVPLGPVPSAWSLEEFYSTPKDDDVKYVGSIADTGLFTPNLEGPNPNRRKQSNNYPTENWGDVWVNAVYKTASGEMLKSRSYLVVGVPVYMHYDQPEVGQ